MSNRKEWSVATRIEGKSGVHIYLKNPVLEKALAAAGIPLDARDLVMRASYMVGSFGGSARILIELRSIKKGVIKDADIETDIL
jgi:hypothetical protein